MLYPSILEKAEDVPATGARTGNKWRLWQGFFAPGVAACPLGGSTGEFQNRRVTALSQNASVVMVGAGISTVRRTAQGNSTSLRGGGSVCRREEGRHSEATGTLERLHSLSGDEGVGAEPSSE